MAFLVQIDDGFLRKEAQRYKSRARKGREPVRPRRGPEKSRVFRRQFSLPRDEFDVMDLEELFAGYVDPVVQTFPLGIESTLGRVVRYFRFDVDEDTETRKTFVLDEDPVFVAVRIQEKTVLTHPQTGGTQDVVEVEIRAEVQAEEGDPDPPEVAALKAMDAAMLAQNP